MPAAADGDIVRLETEAGPIAIERSSIPLMYENGIINPAYTDFLGKVFPAGIPREPVGGDRLHFLYRHCVGLFERKDFGQALACLDALRASVERHGDPEPTVFRLFSWSAPIHSLQLPGGEFPLAVREPLLRSEVLLELGDVAGAARAADAAMQRSAALDFSKQPPPLNMLAGSLPTRTACEISATMGPNACGPRSGNGILTDGMRNLVGAKVHNWSHLAVVYWLNGEAAKSDLAVAAMLAEYGTFEATFNKVVGTLLRSGLVRAYMTRKDYVRALELANDEGHALADIATVGMAILGLATRSGSGGDFLWMAMQDQHSIATRFQVAHARVEVGRFADARAYLDEILGKPEIKAMPGIFWAALYDRGRIAEQDGKPDDAIGFYQQAVDEIERQRSTINTENAKIGFFGDKQDVYQALVRLLFDAGRAEEAFLAGERSKSRALVDMLANKRDFRVAGTNETDIRDLLARTQAGEATLMRSAQADAQLVERASRALPAAATAEGKPASGSEIGAALDAMRNLKVEARDALVAQAPELASLVAVPRLALADIQRALPAGESLVSYYYDAANLYAFVLDAGGLRAVRLKREGLEDDVLALRRAVADRSDAYLPLARALHARLIAPLADGLKGERMLIAGHGVLHYLPFGALADERGFLVERRQLSFLPSASTLKFIGGIRTEGKPGTLLAFGNPDLGDRRYDLVHAEREAREVSALFGGKSTLLVRRDASKQKLKEYGRGYRYLHFATHGRFDAADPLGSALMLASDSVDKAEDRLTIGELYSMRLDADLVTLSACETGLGKVASGDDVVGLVRGFLYAGANRIVSTLWEIDDEATASLMTDFYRRLKSGRNAADALREAQLAARQRFPHPYYWAAFQITGSAR